ncbi:unnamed protein product [Chilo suppressalis]|uniref:Reverse transcriptase domain-containing protein n=1 Tax=Chilo suppressalis TaxID=168631 RepID=A0ABN8BFZ8_CHISP|nr:unnamed protein product [Chilo suppressalis]
MPPALVNDFMDKLAPPWAPIPMLNTSQVLKSLYSNSSGLKTELQSAVSDYKDSALGVDGIPYSFFANVNDNILSYYLQLINTIMLTGDIPLSWKSQIVLPILKPNKPPSHASSYQSRGMLSKTQYGFRKGKSTMDNLSILSTDIRLAFTYNESVVAAFLDLNSAYDQSKLEILEVPQMLTNFIMNILAERKLIISLPNSLEIQRTVWRGLPQGSVLSPLLYSVYNHDFDTLFENNIKLLQYADDLLIYSTNRHIDNSTLHINSALRSLSSWMNDNGLELSASKSTIVIFSRKKNPPPVKIYYNNILIPIEPQVKFLGVILDSKLTGSAHCDFIISKTERLLNLLRCLSGVWWGAHSQSLKLVYNALIRSVLDYGSFLLEPAISTALIKLDNIQSKALRIITGAMRSSPINALQIETCEPPLNIRRQLLANRYLFRLLQFSKHPLLNLFCSLNEEITSASYWAHKSHPCLIVSYRKYISIQSRIHRTNHLPIFTIDYDALEIAPTIQYDLIDKNNAHPTITSKSIIDTEYGDFHHIFTDASKSSPSECTGVGVFHSQFSIVQKTKLPPETSVFTGECIGLLKAVEYIFVMKLRKTVIFCDSMSALQALNKFPFRTKSYFPVIFEIRNFLNKFMKMGYMVVFAWLPSHSGIQGNENSDQLAKEAVHCGDVPTIPLKPWFRKAKHGKTATSILTRMRLGHVTTPAHLSNLGIVSDPTCGREAARNKSNTQSQNNTVYSTSTHKESTEGVSTYSPKHKEESSEEIEKAYTNNNNKYKLSEVHKRGSAEQNERRRPCRAKRMLDMLNINNNKEDEKEDLCVDEKKNSALCLNNNPNDKIWNSKNSLSEQSSSQNNLLHEEICDGHKSSSPDGDFDPSSSDEYIPGSDGYSSDDSYDSTIRSNLASKRKLPRRISTSDSSCTSACSKDSKNCDTLAENNNYQNILPEQPNLCNDIPQTVSQNCDLNNLPEEPNLCNGIPPIVSENSDQNNFPGVPNLCNDLSLTNSCYSVEAKLNNVTEEPNHCNDVVPSCSFWDDKSVTRDGRKGKIRDAKKERRNERIARNISRNQGQEYLTKTGKLKKRKELKELPECRAKCQENIPKQILENVFTEYWNLGSYEKRANYISNFIIIGKKKVSKIDPKKNREYANKYVIKFDNSVYNICKKCFLTTFDESNRFVQTICEKKIKCGNIISSERGRAASCKKIHDDRLEFARQHILKFPAYESHYGRSKTSKTFLSSDLSLAKMYDSYKETTTEPISKTMYNHVFKTLNLSFKQPSVDTCQKCDRLNKQLETATSEEVKAEIKSHLQEHQNSATFAYDLKEKDKNHAKESNDTLVLTFDLQQCLPTPYLKTGMVFYKRQLWTYNLTIHDCVGNKAHCYIWNESISGRGANQIASCVYDFLKYRVPNQWPNVSKIIFYSDTCAGQNKNSIMATMMLVAAHDLPYIVSIEHKFLTPGHTRMEVDSDHSLIERTKKRTSLNIHHPRDWAQLIRSAGRPGKFTVVEMAESNFYDFSEFLKQNFIMKKWNENNVKFVWADVKLLRFALIDLICFHA